MQACQCLLVSISLTRDPLKGSIVSQTVLALRGSDGFSRDRGRRPGVCPRSSSARSYCKYAVKVTPTFATLQRNRGSRVRIQKHCMVFINFCPGPRHDRQAASETGQMSSVETGQMSAVETGQMTAAETSVLSQQKTVKKH